jgi:hypothetical protein
LVRKKMISLRKKIKIRISPNHDLSELNIV